MKTKLLMACALTAAAFAAPAQADVITRDTIACRSEDLLDEFMSYSIKRDENGMMQLLLSGQCAVLSRGAQVSVISPGFSVATIRYRGAKFYTVSEAVR